MFQSVITPTVLYGLSTVPLTVVQLSELDRLQRKTLRLIVGWVRVPEEPWSETMSRMKDKIARSLSYFNVEPWSKQLAIRQWNLAGRVARANAWSSKAARWDPQVRVDAHAQGFPYRTQGRPRQRWDDHIRKFCEVEFPNNHLWIATATNPITWSAKATAYGTFICQSL